jgi:hypothetical protein
MLVLQKPIKGDQGPNLALEPYDDDDDDDVLVLNIIFLIRPNARLGCAHRLVSWGRE